MPVQQMKKQIEIRTLIMPDHGEDEVLIMTQTLNLVDVLHQQVSVVLIFIC